MHPDESELEVTEDLESTAFDWRSNLTERERKEVELAEVYVEKFNHGTTGHNQLVVISKLAEMLDALA